jgi:hypothetical protein
LIHPALQVNINLPAIGAFIGKKAGLLERLLHTLGARIWGTDAQHDANKFPSLLLTVSWLGYIQIKNSRGVENVVRHELFKLVVLKDFHIGFNSIRSSQKI